MKTITLKFEVKNVEIEYYGNGAYTVDVILDLNDPVVNEGNGPLDPLHIHKLVPDMESAKLFIKTLNIQEVK